MTEKKEKSEEKTDIQKLNEKISELRCDVLTKDWKDDKIFQGGKGTYSYLSADKVFSTFAPLFAQHGLEAKADFSELTERSAIGNMSQHWTVRLTVSLTDIETGLAETSSVYGEAGDSGDKGVSKAQTAALKQWFFKKFDIADGIDPDSEAPEMMRSSFQIRTQQEKEEVKSKVLEKAVPPLKKLEVKKPASLAKKEEPKNAPSPPKEETGFVPEGPQAKAIDAIENRWKDDTMQGKVTPEEYDRMHAERMNIGSYSDATAFISKYM